MDTSPPSDDIPPPPPTSLWMRMAAGLGVVLILVTLLVVPMIGRSDSLLVLESGAVTWNGLRVMTINEAGEVECGAEGATLRARGGGGISSSGAARFRVEESWPNARVWLHHGRIRVELRSDDKPLYLTVRHVDLRIEPGASLNISVTEQTSEGRIEAGSIRVRERAASEATTIDEHAGFDRVLSGVAFRIEQGALLSP